jgi:phenylacetate-CoA ligase
MTFLGAKSAVAGLAWPGVPGGAGTIRLALMFQLEQSQWWPPEVLLAQQFRQLDALVRHAAKTVPFYRERLGDLGLEEANELTPETWSRLPILTRRELQESFDALRSRASPKSHGKLGHIYSTGSTATPVRVIKTRLADQFWSALTLRDHLWHRRDTSGRYAAIRVMKGAGAAYPKGAPHRSWGPAIGDAYATGPGALLDIMTKVHQQAEWLQRVNPDYLLTYPSNLNALAHHCLDRGIRLPNLKQVQTMSELLQPEVRALCRQAWGIEVADSYSTQETGYIALQCPEAYAFHVQAEDSLVEILDDHGRACAPGEVGQVVVTPLHNFAMPLLRYAVGDFAEVGTPCPCGRGLPTLARVAGRIRDMVRLPNGELHYPSYQDLLKGLEHVIQFQVVRRAENELEMKLVTRRPLTDDEENEMGERLRDRFRYPFAVAFSYHDEIARGPGGKFQDYLSEVD